MSDKVLPMPARLGPHSVTTNATIGPTLRLMLEHPNWAGETVGEFVDSLVRLCGREAVLGSVEFGIAAWGTGRLSIEWNEHGAVEIREQTGREGA